MFRQRAYFIFSAQIQELLQKGEDDLKVQIKKLKENATIPTRGSAQAAGYDLYAAIDEPVVINNACTLKIGTGVAVAIPEGYVGYVFARSGLATKRGLRPANCVGVIDSDYRGEIIVALHNDNPEISETNDALTQEIIKPGERIAQLVLAPYLPIEFEEVKELDNTERGSGGFGSTGKN